MNKYLILLVTALLNTLIVYGQVPQQVSYQAVATDVNGNELENQLISIRATVISGSANGVEEWIETHDGFTTDEFGLFTISVGMGSPAGGAVASFSDISWGATTFFLKIEMDPSGGTNYTTVGTNQILSVPYALYSKNADRADTANVSLLAVSAQSALNDMDTDPTNELQSIDYSGGVLSLSGGNSINFPIDDDDNDPENEIQDLLFDGQVFTLTGPTGPIAEIDLSQYPFSAPGASSDFPQGMRGEYVLVGDNDYQVPTDKVLYLTSGGREVTVRGVGGGGSDMTHPLTPNMPVFDEATTLADCRCTGFLMDKSAAVTPWSELFSTGSVFTVPVNKVLYIKSGLPYDNAAILMTNGVAYEFYRPNDTRSTRIATFPAGTQLSKPVTTPGNIFLTGYLVDASN